MPSSSTHHDAFRADSIVIIGGSGDLSLRMLLPSLFFLDAENRLPADFRIFGVGLHPPSGDFRDEVRAALVERAYELGIDPHVWQRFCANSRCAGNMAPASSKARRCRPMPRNAAP